MTGRAYIYCRISRDREGAGLGVERQTKDCRELAARLGLTVVGLPYADNDLSAYSGKPRPSYKRMCRDLDQPGAPQVVFAGHRPTRRGGQVKLAGLDGAHHDAAPVGEVDPALQLDRVPVQPIGVPGQAEWPTLTTRGGDTISAEDVRAIRSILAENAAARARHGDLGNQAKWLLGGTGRGRAGRRRHPDAARRAIPRRGRRDLQRL